MSSEKSVVTEKGATRFFHSFGKFLKNLVTPWSHFIFLVGTILVVAASIVLYLPGVEEALDAVPLGLSIAFAIVYSILLVGVLYFAFMWLYVVWKQSKSHLKYLPEVVILLAAFALSVGFKFYVYCQGRGIASFSDVLQGVGLSLYGAIGGLQFEGLPFDAGGECFAIAMYFGSSVLAGLIFLSVIASQAFYEIYCRFWILFKSTSGKDIFIFTALNDETLNIAKSISEDKAKSKSSVIIFAGPSLKPFDRHDANCIEAMSHRYLYWSFSARKKNLGKASGSDSFLARIGLFSWLRRPTNWNEVHVFAFDSDDDHIPNEEENMDYVFLDARNQLGLMKTKAEKKSLRVTVNTEKGLRSIKLSRAELADRYYDNLQRINDANWLLAGVGGPLGSQEHNALSQKARSWEEENKVLASALKRVYAGAKNDPAKMERIDKWFGIPKWHISYYILTKRQINYQAYQDKIGELDREFYDTYRRINYECFDAYNQMIAAQSEHGMKERVYRDARHKSSPSEVNELVHKLEDLDRSAAVVNQKSAVFAKTWQRRKPFSIYVWNESDAISREAQIAMTEDPNTPIIPDPNDTWVRTYGFGPTGQSLAWMLFSYSTAFDQDNGKASDFFCEVLDPEGASKLAGLTKLKVPFSAVFADDLNNPHEDLEGEYRLRRQALLEEAYRNYAVVQEGVGEEHPTAWDIADGLIPNLFNSGLSDEKLQEMLKERHDTLLDPKSVENSEIPVPCFYFHDYGIGDIHAMDVPPEKKSSVKPFRSPFAPRKEQPDYFVVAIGDDYENIRIANDILKSLCSTLDPDKKATVFVNVWDEKNNNLIMGFAKAREKAVAKGSKKTSDISSDAGQIIYYSSGKTDNIRLIIIGNNADIYQRGSILPDRRSRKYNFAYSTIQDQANEDSRWSKENEFFSLVSNEYFEKFGKHFNSASKEEKRPQPRDFIRNLSRLWNEACFHTLEAFDFTDNEQDKEALIAWRSLDVWRRRSSMEAQLWGARFYAELKAWKPREGDRFETLLCSLARLEHQRWMRLHIADGWHYDEKRSLTTQTHPSILPYAFMRWKTGIHDLMNVYIGIASGCYLHGFLPKAKPDFFDAAKVAIDNGFQDGSRVLCSRFDERVYEFIQSAKSTELTQKRKVEILVASNDPCGDRNIVAFALSLYHLRQNDGVYSAKSSSLSEELDFNIAFRQLPAPEIAFGSCEHWASLKELGASTREDVSMNLIRAAWGEELSKRPVFVVSSDSRLASACLLGLAKESLASGKLKRLVFLTSVNEFDDLAKDGTVYVFSPSK